MAFNNQKFAGGNFSVPPWGSGPWGKKAGVNISNLGPTVWYQTSDAEGVWGKNIHDNRYFTEWTDPTVPDGWIHVGADDANNYVEQASETGGLRLVSDGSTIGVTNLNLSASTGEIYLAKIVVSSISGAISVRWLAGTAFDQTITEAGTYYLYMLGDNDSSIYIRESGAGTDVTITELSFKKYEALSAELYTNSDFSSYTGDDFTDWTEIEQGTGTITQVANGARIQGTDTNNRAYLLQTYKDSDGLPNLLYGVGEIADYVSGQAQFSFLGGGSPVLWSASADGVYAGAGINTDHRGALLNSFQVEDFAWKYAQLYEYTGNTLSETYLDPNGLGLQQGNKASSSYHAQQATASKRPEYKASDGSLYFDGTDDYLDTGWVPGATGTVIIRSKNEALTDANETILGRYGFSGSAFGRMYLRYNDGDIEYGIGDEAGVDIAAHNNEYQVIALSWDGAVVRPYVNGTPISSDLQTGSPSEATEEVYIGTQNASGTASTFGEVSVTDMLFFDTKLTDTQINNISKAIIRRHQ